MVHVILAEVDAAEAEKHRQAALKALDAAIEKREKSPYLEAFVRLREMLKPAGG